ncbi:MAG: hypothetical protein R2792_15445 [Saprospiraceae bacterium]
MTIQNRRYSLVFIATSVLLLIPLVAMLFTNEVDWSPFDFLIMGGLLLSAGLAIEFFTRKVKNKTMGVILVLSTLLVFLLIWAELAVGVFGTPFAGH